MLTSMGAVEGAVAADLFAGSGALGIEALSRGAARVTFVEADRRPLAVLVANLAVIGELAARAEVVRADVPTWLAPVPAGAGPARFDLVLCDPPYGSARWAELFSRLEARVVGTGLVVAESDRALEPGPAWRVLRSRSYGGTVVTLARPQDPAERGTV